MAKIQRVQRPKGELRQELIEQLSLLRNACETYDKGLEAIGKHIALSLRVLLHQHGQSRSLLDQLGLRSGKFFDTAGPLNPSNLMAEFPLVAMRMADDGGAYLPMVMAPGGGPHAPQPLAFVDWWNLPVIKDGRGHTFCRRDLIQNVANTDGGAHVDPELEANYMRLSRENSLGWVFSDGNIRTAFRGRPELACMRQIAHEVLLTINANSADFGKYAEPVLPSPQVQPSRSSRAN